MFSQDFASQAEIMAVGSELLTPKLFSYSCWRTSLNQEMQGPWLG
jgi:hypothetical protein